METIIKYFDKNEKECNKESDKLHMIIKQKIEGDRLISEEVFFRDV